YYIRHAETVANVLEDPSQTTLEDLDTFTELGTRQVEAMTTFLLASGIAPDAVLVSPTWRSQNTIAPYLARAGLTGEIWLELSECCAEDPTGGPLPTEPTFYEYYEASLEAENLAFRDDARANWQNDTYEDGLFMVMTARDALLERFGNSGKSIIISGHAVAGSILIGLLLGEDMTAGEDEFIMENRLFMMNTGMHHLEQDPDTGLFQVVDTNINDPVSE
ncbi:histidine phosphatase family protein, partial [Myxococcota bacterium]